MLRRAIFCLAMLLAAGGALRAVGADSETEAFIRDISEITCSYCGQKITQVGKENCEYCGIKFENPQ